jgi:hypothetical protein
MKTLSCAGFMLLSLTSGLQAQEGRQQQINQAIDAAQRICLVGSRYKFAMDASGKVTISKLLPGAETHLDVDRAEATGGVLFQNEDVRKLVDDSIRNCMERQWPDVLKAFESPSTPKLNTNELEFWKKVATILKSRANSCLLGQPINTSGTKFLDVCLCLGDYDDLQRTLSYQIKIKGKDSNRDEYQGHTRWITYEYNTSASFNSPVKTDKSLTRIELHADTRYPVLKVGPVSKVDILYDNIWRDSVAGQKAFWWSYLAATDQHGQPEEAPLDWSMGIPLGSTTIGSQSSSGTFNVVSIERCGF